MTDSVTATFRDVLVSRYRSTVVIVANTLVLLVLLNAILFVVFLTKDRFNRRAVEQRNESALATVYPDLSRQDRDDLLTESHRVTLVYDPFTQYRERPSQGRFVNVDAQGFRTSKNQGPWPPRSIDLNVFMFGGSTTFGYLVPDHQTIASYLQEYLAEKSERTIRVYNFGHGYYYSVQERALYEQLLASGVIPDLAIFVDGLNDFYFHDNEPTLTDQFRQFVA